MISEMKTELSSRTVVVATKNEISCKLGEEAAILGLKNSVYYGLNAVGARIWDLLQEPKRLGDVQTTIVSEYDVSAEQAERDLVRFVRGMLAEGLIEISGPDGPPHSGHQNP